MGKEKKERKELRENLNKSEALKALDERQELTLLLRGLARHELLRSRDDGLERKCELKIKDLEREVTNYIAEEEEDFHRGNIDKVEIPVEIIKIVKRCEELSCRKQINNDGPPPFLYSAFVCSLDAYTQHQIIFTDFCKIVDTLIRVKRKEISENEQHTLFDFIWKRTQEDQHIYAWEEKRDKDWKKYTELK